MANRPLFLNIKKFHSGQSGIGCPVICDCTFAIMSNLHFWKTGTVRVISLNTLTYVEPILPIHTCYHYLPHKYTVHKPCKVRGKEMGRENCVWVYVCSGKMRHAGIGQKT